MIGELHRDETALSEARARLRPGLAALVVGLGAAAIGCTSASAATAVAAPKPVAAAPPPRDDGRPSQDSEGGDSHAAALEQLRTTKLAPRADKQNSVLVPLPDAQHWTRVRFLTVKSLVGFRYGKSHHAVVAAFVTHVDDNQADSACSKSFERWAKPYVDAFEVELEHDAPAAFTWSPAAPGPPGPKAISIVEVDPLFAKTATVLSRESYAGAWAAYPVWDNACLIVGAAVPARGEDGRAREVRDRFVKEVFPNVKVVASTEPPVRY